MKTYLINISTSGNGRGYSARDISDVINFLKIRNEKFSISAYKIKGYTSFFADGELSNEEVEHLVSEIKLTSIATIWSGLFGNPFVFAKRFSTEELESKASVCFDEKSFRLL